MKNEVMLRPTYWASVSGGKDSLYMFYYIMNHLDEYPLNGAVHFELEIDYPFIKNVIDYMESECTRKNIPFIRVKPDKTWNEIYKIKGYPTHQRRWCNSEYKLNAKKKFIAYLRDRNLRPIWYIGFCADEAKRFKVPLFDDSSNERYPIAEQGINEYEILQWAQNQDIFNDYYKYNRRCGCMGCPLSSYIGTAYDAIYYPDHFNSYMKCAELTEEQVYKKTGKRISVWQGDSKYDTKYRRRIIEEKYIPKLKGEL